MNRIKFFLLITFIILITFSCYKKDYETTLINYLEFLKKGEFKKAYDLLYQNDKDSMNIDEFINEEKSSIIGKIIRKKIKYKILSCELSVTKIAVTIKTEINQIDLLSLYNLIPALAKEYLTEKEIIKIFNANNKLINSLYIKRSVTYKLIKENNAWYVATNFGRQKRQKELVRIANQYYNNYDYLKSSENYAEALSFDNYNEEALKGSLIVKEKLNYISKYLKLNYELQKKDKNKLYYKIKIKNTGTFIIKKSLLIFYFKVKNKTINSSKIIFTDNNENIGYQNEVEKIIGINNINAYYDIIECTISGIDFN